MNRRDVINAIAVFLAAVALSFVAGLTINEIHLARQNHTLSTRIAKDEKLLEGNINSQVPNRVRNVKVWCSAINQDRDYARSRADARRLIDPTVRRYRLPDLDCVALARKTADSAAHDPVLH